MIIDMRYWTRVLRRILILTISIVCLLFSFKLAVFYIPFLVAFIISLMVEPVIKFFMKKFKLTRKLSAIIILLVVFGTIIGFLTWGIITLISEASNLMTTMNDYMEKAYVLVQSILEKFSDDKIKISDDIRNILQNISNDVITKGSNILRNLLNKILEGITQIPEIAIYTVITLLALYFVCTDKIYMLDQIEHHLPREWVEKMDKHIKELIKILGGYLRAQLILIGIAFAIVLVGLTILSLIGFNVKYPLLAALGIGFVDSLPILRITEV